MTVQGLHERQTVGYKGSTHPPSIAVDHEAHVRRALSAARQGSTRGQLAQVNSSTIHLRDGTCGGAGSGGADADGGTGGINDTEPVLQ